MLLSTANYTHRFARGRRGGCEGDVLLPGGGPALHSRSQLAADQRKVDEGVCARIRGKDDAVDMLAVHHQLSCHQVDLHTLTAVVTGGLIGGLRPRMPGDSLDH